MKIGIVSDSATGFTSEELKKYPNLTIIPLVIIEHLNSSKKDSKEDVVVYQDDSSLTSELLYKKVINERKKITTSQTNRGDLEKYWDEALKKFDQILFLPIGEKASGQYASAFVLQKEEKYRDKVHIWETGAASIPLKVMAIIAYKLSQENKSIPEIIKALATFRETYDCYISPDNLTYLARGGRGKHVTATVANFLKIKAIIKCKNEIINVSKRRTLKSACDEMLSLILKTKNAINETIYIIDGWCEQKIVDMAIALLKARGFTKYKIEKLCNILVVHTGNNTIGFSIAPSQIFKE